MAVERTRDATVFRCGLGFGEEPAGSDTLETRHDGRGSQLSLEPRRKSTKQQKGGRRHRHLLCDR